MHEMSLAENVLQLIQDAAEREGFQRVKAVWLEIGARATVVPQALEFCFDAVTRGSLAEGARLEFIAVPAGGICLACSQAVVLAPGADACPQCGSYQLQITSGDDMRVKELEVE